jgi:UDP-N-acetylmuramate--alanine ligase
MSSFKQVHFIGIGGIGVSYLAQWYLARGWQVSGSDLQESPILKILRRKGALIRVGRHTGRNIPKGTDLVIYTLAATPANPERIEAKRRDIPQISHAKALGEITKTHYSIAIAGSHGKSTTTALAGILLTRAGLDPTVFLGTTLKEFGGTNCRIGRSPYLVFEADEWQGAFWNYHPQIAVITNIDREHLDFYKNLGGVRRGFVKFLKNLRSGGSVIMNADDPGVLKLAHSNVLKNIRIRQRHYFYFYSLKQPENKCVRKILKIPGEHNVSNGLAVAMLAKALGIPRKKFLRAIASYRGAWRRFEYRGTLQGAKLFDDYAHHPTEIKATLEAAKTLLKKGSKLWCVFQPHQYRRLQVLFRDFTSAFDKADRIVILPVYAVSGREGDSISVNAEHLAGALVRRGLAVQFAASFRQAAAILKTELSAGDVCLLMGAGDIVNIHECL